MTAAVGTKQKIQEADDEQTVRQLLHDALLFKYASARTVRKIRRAANKRLIELKK